MDHLKAIIIKFLASTVVLYVILGLFYGMSFGSVLILSLILGVVSYIVGDMIILPKTNNTTATIADFLLSLLVIWAISRNMTYTGGYPNNFFSMALISTIFITAFEYFFHKYLVTHVINDNPKQNQRTDLQYQTEASEELLPKDEDE